MSVPHQTHIPLQSHARLANCPIVSLFSFLGLSTLMFRRDHLSFTRLDLSFIPGSSFLLFSTSKSISFFLSTCWSLPSMPDYICFMCQSFQEYFYTLHLSLVDVRNCSTKLLTARILTSPRWKVVVPELA